ncbi:ArsR/SmtB family transcription factor [Halobaculum halobium]|uniref:ArsR/SmtB family transcription factor n=1 Tax=Halobaculum halobium TaxID=3032281 RepID=UPI00360B3DEE
MGVDESSRRTFELLANETRLGIISALGEASGEGGYATLSFSELQEATGIEDNGHFNYHLKKLVEEFVEDREDGYALTLAGIRAYQAIVAQQQLPSTEVARSISTAPMSVTVGESSRRGTRTGGSMLSAMSVTSRSNIIPFRREVSM